MGMFDSVFAPCPKCGEAVEFQSKAGDCRLRRYHMDSVPPEIAASVNGSVEQCSCGELVKLLIPHPLGRVQMAVEQLKEWD